MREQFIDYLSKKGYIPIEDDVYNISKRIKKYDNDLVLFYNPGNKRYEVHTCTFFPSKRPTYCVSNEFCDYELLEKLRKADNRVITFNKKMQMVEESKLMEEIAKEKKEQDLRENFISRMKKEDKGIRHFYMGR